MLPKAPHHALAIAGLLLGPTHSQGVQGGRPVWEIGPGCASSKNDFPALHLQSDLGWLPADWNLQAKNIQAVGGFGLSSGLNTAPASLSRCIAWMDPANISLPTIPDASGTVRIPIPEGANLCCLAQYPQAFAPDLGSPSVIASGPPLQVAHGSESGNIGALLSAFASSDRASVDLARAQLLEQGFGAVVGLVALSNAALPQHEYYGSSVFNPLTNRLRRLNQRTVLSSECLYLVDEILLGRPRPYRDALLSGPLSSQSALAQEAADRYEAWLGCYGTSGQLQDLQSAPHPLDGGSVRWASPILPVDPNVFDPDRAF